MRVGVFVPNRERETGGGFTFENELFRGLIKNAGKMRHELILFAPDDYPFSRLKELSDCDFETVRIRHIPLRRLKSQLSRIINLFFTRVLSLPNLMPFEDWIDPLLFKHRVSFFLNLTPMTLTKEVPYLTFLWDLQHRLQPFFPEITAGGRWVRWEDKFATFLRRAAIIVVATETGKAEVQRFYGIPDARIKIVPYTAPDYTIEVSQKSTALPAEVANLPSPFVFYPAQFWPHKNHVTLLHAVAILREKYSFHPHVVFSGSDQGNLSYVKKVASDLGLADQVHFLGFVSKEELIALYQNALALVYTSMFGPDNLPPLEAFALDCPVIAAKVAGSEEHLGEAAMLVDPTDEETFAKAVYRLNTEPGLRENLIEKGRERTAKFTSEDFIAGIVSTLDEFEPIRRCWSEDRFAARFSWRRMFRG